MNNLTPSREIFELQLEDSFDALAVVELRETFDQLVDRECDVILNLQRVTFIDSSGLGAIVFLFKRLRGLDKTLKIINIQGQPLQLLQYLRVDQVIDMAIGKGEDHE